jgi:hypothetical protein
MDIEIGKRIYDAYLAIYDMDLREGLRREMLTWAFVENPDHWPVVGITHAALERFAEHDFRCVSKMGIHRAHLMNRRDWQATMLATRLPFNAWLDLYTQSDRTVLATSSENMKGQNLDFIPIAVELGLFRSTGYRWRHTVAEREFLRNLHVQIEPTVPAA